VINDDNRELDAKELLQIPEAAVAFVNSQNLFATSRLGTAATK
jgi:hypothetical protein